MVRFSDDLMDAVAYGSHLSQVVMDQSQLTPVQRVEIALKASLKQRKEQQVLDLINPPTTKPFKGGRIRFQVPYGFKVINNNTGIVAMTTP